MKRCKSCGVANSDDAIICKKCHMNSLITINEEEAKAYSIKTMKKPKDDSLLSRYESGNHSNSVFYMDKTDDYSAENSPQYYGGMQGSVPGYPNGMQGNPGYPGAMPPQYQGGYFSPHKSNIFRRLGGFLKVIVVMNYIYAVYGIIAGIALAVAMAGVINLANQWGESIPGLGLFAFFLVILMLVVSILSIVFSNLIRAKDPDFLRFYQIVSVIEIVATIILMLIDRHLTNTYYYYVSNNSLLSNFISMLIGFTVGNIYFCNSERVYYYMGSNAYIKRSLYTSFVTRWDMIEASKYANQAPSKLEMASRNMSSSAGKYTSQSSSHSTTQPANSSTTDSNVSLENLEALKKFKELLDMGAISQEEFDKQKQKLMPGDAYNNDAATFGANGASDDDSATVAASDLDEGFDWICNSCQKQNPADSKCCSYCGGIKKIVGYTVMKDSPEPAQAQASPQTSSQAQTNASVVMAYCPFCGSPLESGARFCVYCGNEVQ